MKTYLDWSAYRDAGMGDAYADIPRRGGDFAKAVAVCISSRQCETDGRGVMCPSYRVTGDAAQTPGGRVRHLKRALNAAEDDALVTDPELAEAMASCVGCKGCKRECENSVDLAQAKIEYLAQRNAAHGIRLRARLFAHLPRWLHRHPRLRGFLIAGNRLPWLRRLAQRGLGVSRRPLPEPAPRPFQAPPAGATFTDGPRAVLLVDTFTRQFEPEVAHAALEVLRAMGAQVTVAETGAATAEPDRPLCCGRSYLAQGMVAEAREEARRMVEALAPYAAAGVPVIGLEPACLLAVRDDYRSLGLGESAAMVTRQAWLFEEFVAKELKAGSLRPRWRDDGPDAPILVHGHCHQKAVGAMKSMRKVLKAIPGAQFEIVEASCCGMAGSFGYEAEHASLSRAMAEQALLPALRVKPEATVVANGFSCRQQIRDGCSHRPRHLALLLREHLTATG